MHHQQALMHKYKSILYKKIERVINMINEIDITDPVIAKEVLEIQILSYRVEAKIINFYDIPPLKDTVETLQQCGETFFGYYHNEELCGTIAITTKENVIDIQRLVVHPAHFRQGMAKKLLKHVEQQNKDCHMITVATGTQNTPAVNFYIKNGFLKTTEEKITESVSLTYFKKELPRK